MKIRIASWLILYAAALLASCGRDTQNVNAKLNPHPIPYEITITIDGAPGPFNSVGGFMQYEVTNKDCVPETGGPMNALRLQPHTDPPITFQKVSGNVYKGTVYVDYFQDEDYFGLGVCHWSLMSMTAELHINKLKLVPFLLHDQILSQQSAATFFLKDDYEDSSEIRSSFGEGNKSRYKPELQAQIFSITLSAREIRP